MLTFTELLESARRFPLYDGWRLCQSKLPEQPGDSIWLALPTLDSEQLTRYASSFSHSFPKGVRNFLSSGTQGKPKLIPFSEEDLERVTELCHRFSVLEGINAQTRSMVLLPMASWTVGKITMDGHRKAGAQVYGVDLHGGVEVWQQAFEAIRPNVISSTPSVLAAWAKYYEGPPMSLLETTGEPLLEYERRIIESRFGAFVHDAYGLTECVVGVECAMRHGFHYWPDSVHVEILDSSENIPLPPGMVGEVVLTSFQQGSLPILRYRSGDLGWLSKNLCPCGRREPLLHLHGRKAPTLTLPRGVSLERGVLEGALKAWGYVQPQVKWKGTPGSPATPFVADHFKPTLEIILRRKAEKAGDSIVRRRILDQFPELAELVHEQELELVFSDRGSDLA